MATRKEVLAAIDDALAECAPSGDAADGVRCAMRAVHPLLSQLVDASICFFGVYDEPAQAVDVVWQVHNLEELPGGRFPLGDGFTSRVVRTGQSLLIRDWQTSGSRVQVQYAAGGGGLPRSSVTAPARYRGRTRGVLSVQSYEPDAFGQDDRGLLERVANRVASIALARHDGRRVSRPETSTGATGVVVLDARGQLLQVNAAARRLLCSEHRGLIFGHPVCEPQGQHWPLGTQRLADGLRPLVDALSHGLTPAEEVPLELDGGERLVCSGALVQHAGREPQAVLQFRRIGA